MSIQIAKNSEIHIHLENLSICWWFSEKVDTWFENVRATENR